MRTELSLTPGHTAVSGPLKRLRVFSIPAISTDTPCLQPSVVLGSHRPLKLAGLDLLNRASVRPSLATSINSIQHPPRCIPLTILTDNVATSNPQVSILLLGLPRITRVEVNNSGFTRRFRTEVTNGTKPADSLKIVTCREGTRTSRTLDTVKPYGSEARRTSSNFDDDLLLRPWGPALSLSASISPYSLRYFAFRDWYVLF